MNTTQIAYDVTDNHYTEVPAGAEYGVHIAGCRDCAKQHTERIEAPDTKGVIDVLSADLQIDFPGEVATVYVFPCAR